MEQRDMTNPARMAVSKRPSRATYRRRMRSLGIFKARRQRSAPAPVLARGPFGLPIIADENAPGGVVRVARTGGSFNFPYGVRPGASKSILRVHEEGARQSLSGQISAPPLDYNAMTRDQLRDLAKHKGVEGWHKMNKKALIEAVSA